MSYASIASHNIPEGEMPKPDQSLLDGHHANEHEHSAIHQEEKINILPAGTDLSHPPVDNTPAPRRADPASLSSTSAPATSDALNVAPEPTKVPVDTKKWDEAEERAAAALSDGKKEAKDAAEKTEEKAKSAADKAEKEAKKAGDKISKEAKKAGDKISKEAKAAKIKSAEWYEQVKEVVLRPGVAGGLAGAFNVAVLGTIGYFSYQNWNRPWDRRIVVGVVAGLIGLSGLEGYAGKVYQEKELPKH